MWPHVHPELNLVCSVQCTPLHTKVAHLFCRLEGLVGLQKQKWAGLIAVQSVSQVGCFPGSNKLYIAPMF